MAVLKEKATEKQRKSLIEEITKQYKRTSKHKISKKEIQALEKELNSLSLNKLVIRFNCSMGSMWYMCQTKDIFKI